MQVPCTTGHLNHLVEQIAELIWSVGPVMLHFTLGRIALWHDRSDAMEKTAKVKVG